MTDALPVGWSWLRLDELAAQEPNAITDGPFGSNLKTSDYVEDGEVRVIRLGNLGVGRFIHKDRSFVSAAKFESLKKHEARPGDLIVAALAEPVGRCVEVPPDLGTAMVKADCVRVRLNPVHDHRYVMNAMNSPAGLKRTAEAAHGLGRLRVNLGDLRSILVPTAPPSEQRRIVAKLESLNANSRRAREALDAVPPLLERLRQSILAAAFRGDLTKDWRAKQKDVEPASELLKRVLSARQERWNENERSKNQAKGKPASDEKWKARYQHPDDVDVDAANLRRLPEGWSWVNVGMLAWSVKDGPHHSPTYVESGVPFISGRNVRADGVDFSTAKFISPEKHAEYSLRCKPDKGDVLYTKGGTTGIARVNTYDLDFNVWVHVAVLKLSDAVLPFYLQHALNSPECYRQAQGLTHGVGNQDLGLSRIIKIVLPLAPKEEQTEIVKRVDSSLLALTSLLTGADASFGLLEQLDRSILAKAFRGELVAQHPNDTPVTLPSRDEPAPPSAKRASARKRKAG